MPVPLRNLYDANQCDLKVCSYLNDKYGPLSSNNWNKLPVDWQSTWKNVACDSVVAQCPALAGYLSSFGDDHNSDDIGNGRTSAAATCASNKRCWGYNDNGWMKPTGIPNFPSSNTCWRIKISTTMLDAQGCWQYAQSYPDSVPCYTLGSAPYDTWYLWVDSDCDRRICAYFAARFGVVAADNSSQEASSWANLPDKYKPSWRVLYCNDVLGGWSSSCPAVPGYVGTPDVDHLMDELGYYPYNTSAACTANAACKGFSSTGFTKSSASPNTVRPGACWYSKLS
ncbi:hypothetical protein GPECTOR_16g695 [Gonium pectorale]|uniref:Uncharacterized protein n=1 Tax=Gonium pectorale TaxID=33097 RepID=A0A150GMG2_GONPE|nr:hypothetical protein GPECTOR_16g695 [Gonium pectorale]|eukprot:KXZ50520.1 hypothetical protein GPECTOR_16g695 [Gonium pectorale]